MHHIAKRKIHSCCTVRFEHDGWRFIPVIEAIECYSGSIISVAGLDSNSNNRFVRLVSYFDNCCTRAPFSFDSYTYHFKVFDF